MKRIYFILLHCLFVISTALMMLPNLTKTIANELHFSVELGGWIIAGFAFFSGLSALIVGPYINQKGTLFFLRWGSLLMVFATLFAYLSHNFFLFLTAQILLGILYGILINNILSYISDKVEFQNRGKAMGVSMIGSFLGQISGYFLCLYLASLGSFKNAYLFLLILSVINAVTIFFLPKTQTPLSSERITFKSFFQKYRLVLKNKQAVLLTRLLLLMWIGLYLFMPYYTTWLAETFLYHDLQDFAFLFLYGSLGAIIASPLVGYLSDKIKKVKLIAFFNMILAVCFAAAPFFSHSYLAHYFLIFIATFAAAARLAPYLTLMSGVVSPQDRSSLFGISNMIPRLGIAIGSGLSGVVYAFGFQYNGLITFGLLTLVSVIILFVQEPVAEPKN